MKAEPNAVAQRFEVSRPARQTQTVKGDAFDWSKVETDDYRKYIANLRAIGCPEETVRDIIIADINKMYGAKRAALYPSAKDFKFWQTRTRDSRDTERERERQLRDLDREKQALVKELLGVDLEQEMAKWSGEPTDEERRYGFLPPEKQQQVQTLREKYRDLERAAFSEGGGWNAETRAKMTSLRAQREAEMAQLLTPQEFEEYQLRNSGTARSMRENLASFEPTENEFREIFRLQKVFDDQFGMMRDGGDETVRQQKELARQQVDEQMRALLGDQRFKDYQLAQDDQFRELSDFAQRNNLPKEAVTTIYDVKKLAESEKKKLERDQTLPEDQRRILLAALAQQTQKSLSDALGQTYNQYRKAGGGGWLDRLSGGGDSNRQRGGDRGDRNRDRR